MIQISHLHFSYHKDKEVLSDISLEINKGECVVLLGPNGVGKSTLINVLLGTYKPQKGEIFFEDKLIKNLKVKDKADYISYVPQLLNGTELTVGDTVLLGRLPYYKIYPNKEDHKELHEIIDKFHLNEIIDKPTNEISGGERQKTNIARAFIQNSKLVVFDEPTSNLDIKAQLEILSLIKSEKKEKEKSFLISMHDINQALEIGDKFVFMKESKILKICAKEDITSSLIDEVYGVHSKIINTEKGEIVIYED